MERFELLHDCHGGYRTKGGRLGADGDPISLLGWIAPIVFPVCKIAAFHPDFLFLC